MLKFIGEHNSIYRIDIFSSLINYFCD